MATPTTGNDVFTGLLGTRLVITPADLLGNDTYVGSNPTSIAIDALPTGGSLYLNNVLVTAGQSVTWAQLNTGKLTFQPTDFTTQQGAFSYTITDAGGTSAPSTATINFGIDTLQPGASINDGITNASQYQYVYAIDFQTVDGLTSNASKLSLATPTTMTDNSTGVGVDSTVVANPGAATGGPTSANDNLEYSNEFIGLAPGSGFSTYLNSLIDPATSLPYGAGAFNLTYSGWELNGEPVISVFNNVEQTSSYFLLTNNANIPSATSLGNASPAIFNYTICFEKSTFISTPFGERLVSSLAIGDEVIASDGRIIKVKWIGRQTINSYFAKLKGNLPVKISAGALGEGLPSVDLLVSPNHAIYVDGLLIHAIALVNESTISQLQAWAGNVEYYHIETDGHELVLANGVPAETFIDNVSRKEFDNWVEYESLYPNASAMIELDLPRVKFSRQLPRAISQRLEGIAKNIGISINQIAA